MNKLAKVSDLSELAQAITREHGLANQAFKTALHHAIKAGELLKEAKAKVGHGAWLPWLQENCHVSERTAQGYMRLAREFPKLDSEKAQRVADLPLRAALKEIAQERREYETYGTLANHEEEFNPDEWSDMIGELNIIYFPNDSEYQIESEPGALYRYLKEKDDGSMSEREKVALCLCANVSKHLCYWTLFAKDGKEPLPEPVRKYLDAGGEAGQWDIRICKKCGAFPEVVHQ